MAGYQNPYMQDPTQMMFDAGILGQFNLQTILSTGGPNLSQMDPLQQQQYLQFLEQQAFI